MSLRTLRDQGQQSVGKETREQLLRVEEQQEADIEYEEEELDSFDDDDVVSAFIDATDDGKTDTTSAGHLAIRRNRQVLYYLRLIENEVPKLVCKPLLITPFNALKGLIHFHGLQHYEKISLHPRQLPRSLFVPLTTLARNILPLTSGPSLYR